MFQAVLCRSSGAQNCDLQRIECGSTDTVRVAALQASDRHQSGDIIPHAVNHSLALLRICKELPETCRVNLKINKLLLLHVVGPLLYLYRWSTVKHTSNAWYVCPILIERYFSRQILIEAQSIKFHEHQSSGSWLCSIRTDGWAGGRIDKTKIICVFRFFSNATKIVREFVDCTFLIFMYSKINFDPDILVALTAHDSLVTAPRVVCWGLYRRCRRRHHRHHHHHHNLHELGLIRPVSDSSIVSSKVF